MPDDNTPKRILLVDDEPRITLVLSRGLKILGQQYAIDTASDGQSALTKLQQQFYHLVITDIQMPHLTGIDLVQQAVQLSPKTQFVLMTAHDSPTLRHTIATLPIEGYIEKPFTLQEVRSIIVRLLEPITLSTNGLSHHYS